MARKKKVLGTGVESMSGVVESISMRDDGEFGSVSIRHGPKPKRNKSTGELVGDFPRTTHLELPKGEVQAMKLGEKVTVRVDRSSQGPKMVRS